MNITVKQLIVPVDDQERAKAFWTEQMGFEIARDEIYGDERWMGGGQCSQTPRGPALP